MITRSTKTLKKSVCTAGRSTVCLLQFAAAFVKKALNTVKQQALHADKVDWNKVDAKVAELTADAASAKDTYDAIHFVLAQLGDNHSFLVAPDARRTAIRRDDSADRKLVSRRSRAQSGIYDDGPCKIGSIVLPAFGGATGGARATNFAQTVRTTIMEFQSQNVGRWIIDLRGNDGGNMWPMLVALGPLIGVGKLGSFVGRNFSTPWFYESGAAGVEITTRRKTLLKVVDALKDDEVSSHPVAVLLDGETASSGEAIAISFKGRPKTVFIGESTRGLTTANNQIRLGAGATLYLTIAVDADREGNIYDSGVHPDMLIKSDGLSVNGDAVFDEAVKWLSR